MRGPRVVVELHGAMTSDDVARACQRVERLLRAQIPVRARVAAADLAVVEALARMQLCARRLQTLFDVVGADEGCVELVALVGLTDVLQVQRQAEPLEERGVEEVVDVGDPSA